MKNEMKHKHPTTARFSLRLPVAMATQGWVPTHILNVVLQLSYAFDEKIANIGPVEEISIYFLYHIHPGTVNSFWTAWCRSSRSARFYSLPILTLAWWLW